jgi:molecular chaperone GrpE (heat shock protein)
MIPLWEKLKSEFLSDSSPQLDRNLERISNEVSNLRVEIDQLRKVLYLLSLPTEIEKKGVLQFKSLKEELDQGQQILSKLGRDQMEMNITLESLSQLWEENSIEGQKCLSAIKSLEKVIKQWEAGLSREIRDAFVNELHPLIQVLDGLEESLSYAEESTIPICQNHRPRNFIALIRRLFKGKSLEEGRKYFDKAQWIEGLRITQRKLEEFFRNMGISVIEAVGKPFDPHQHQSVGVYETSEMEENMVVKEEIKGYRYGDSIIRYPQVVVSKSPAQGGGTSYASALELAYPQGKVWKKPAHE